jgi:hypothetical protein
MQEQALRDLYHQSLDLNTQAFAGRCFEVAYHSLAAAMHCAEEMRDAGLLVEVRRFAEDQARWIDTNAPQHKLSSRSAKRHNHESIFATLARLAHTLLLGLEVAKEAKQLGYLNRGLLPAQESRGEGAPSATPAHV